MLLKHPRIKSSYRPNHTKYPDNKLKCISQTGKSMIQTGLSYADWHPLFPKKLEDTARYKGLLLAPAPAVVTLVNLSSNLCNFEYNP